MGEFQLEVHIRYYTGKAYMHLKSFVLVNCGWSENYFARNGGELSSPGYPNFNYPNNMDCTTLIYVDHGFQVVVDITFFSLENNFDFLTVSKCSAT